MINPCCLVGTSWLGKGYGSKPYDKSVTMTRVVALTSRADTNSLVSWPDVSVARLLAPIFIGN